MTTPVYDKILVAVDVFSEYQPVVERALSLCKKPDDLFLIYVTYPQTSYEPYGLYLEKDYTDEVRARALEILEDCAKQYDIPNSNVFVEYGAAADEIHSKATKIDAQLIVIGTHGQSGMQLLLGSTANSVLHGVTTDVLAVKLNT